MPCTFRLLPPRVGKCWLFRARERTRHVLRQVFIVGNGLVAARKMVRATPADEAHASGLAVAYTSLPAGGPRMPLAWQLFRRVECAFRQVRVCAYRRPPATNKGPRTGTPTRRIGSPDPASQRGLSTGRWHQNGNIGSCGAVFTCGFCAAYQSSEPVMKALHLAATAVTFAAIFSALMLCGAALTATLHKAIASAPVSAILS